MAVLNALLGRVFDVLCLPLRLLPQMAALVLVSAVIAVGMLLVIKRTSNQRGIAAVKSKIQASIFEIRLFNDDPPAIFRALFDGLRHNAVYLGLSLVPLAWMIVPLVLTMTHLNSRFGYRPLSPGDVTMVRAKLADGWRADFAGVDEGARPPVSLESSPAVDVLTPAVWLPSKNEVLWKVAVRQAGSQSLNVKLGETMYTKSLQTGGGLAKRSAMRPGGVFLDQLLYPSEPPLPKGPLRAIEVAYPNAGWTFLDMPQWIWIFFVLSIVFAFALKGPLRVEI